MVIATEEIESERGISQGDEELEMLGSNLHATSAGNTSYQGVPTTATYPYEGDMDRVT